MVSSDILDKCSVVPNDRTDCGWPGIGQTKCLRRGCCHDTTYTNTAWCFFPTGKQSQNKNLKSNTQCEATIFIKQCTIYKAKT